MKLRTVLLFLLPVLLAALGTTGALAATLVVPDEYPTIQQAIDAASVGDTVYVGIGTYYENLTIGKSLTLEGEDRDATIIDGGGSGNVVYVSVDYVTIEGLTVANGQNGIALIANYTIDHFTIRNAVITGNSGTGFSAPHNNRSSYHTIENCIFSYNAGCSYAHQFGYSVIQNCEVFENGSGFSVAWGSYTTISNNTFYNNGGTCIHIDSGTYNTIEGNEVYDNDGCGLSVGYVGNNNTFRNNSVRNNGCGISMGGPSVRNNRIYNNDIIDNATQAYDEEGDNFWDNGYPSGGNFWSDYVGVDLYSGPSQDIPGSDGIGDTSYLVFFTGIDHYPLIESQIPRPLGLSLGILENPYLTQYLDIFLIGSRALDSASVELKVDEQAIAVRQVDSEHDVWLGDYKLSEDDGVISVTGCASDAAGNDTCVTASFSSSLLYAERGGSISSLDGRVSVNIDPDVLLSDTYLILLPCRDDEAGSQSVGNAGRISSLRLLALDGMTPGRYYVGPRAALGSGTAYLEFHYTDSDLGPQGTPGQLHIVQEGIGPLESYVDPVSNTVGAEISEFGEFRLASGTPATSTVTDPRYLRLHPSYPNPFSIGAAVRFEVRAPQHVRATVHDVTGRVIANLLDESIYPGVHQVSWDGTCVSGSSAASGLYFIRVETEHSISSGKIVKLR